VEGKGNSKISAWSYDRKSVQRGETTLPFHCQVGLAVMRNMAAFWDLTLCRSVPIYQPTWRHASDVGNTDTAGSISDTLITPRSHY
jgi:hypothetical protein